MRTRFRKPLLYPLSYGGRGTLCRARSACLVSELVALDREYTAEPRDERWEDWYAGRLLERFGTA